MYVCMCVYIYIYIDTYVSTHTCIHVYIYYSITQHHLIQQNAIVDHVRVAPSPARRCCLRPTAPEASEDTADFMLITIIKALVYFVLILLRLLRGGRGYGQLYSMFVLTFSSSYVLSFVVFLSTEDTANFFFVYV